MKISRQTKFRGALITATATAALTVTAVSALAGGFAVREQSASLMGAAFAGAAAGGDLSSAFWNPAAFGTAENGLTTQSAYSAIFADTELSNGSTNFPVGGATSTDIDKIGLLSASYAAYRLSDKMVLGVSVNAPFGLATDPDNANWVGRFHSREAEMMTLNAAPTLAYEVVPGVHVAAGIQLEYAKLKLWSATPLPGAPSASIKVDDTVGVGFTAGILLKPAEGTSVGLGFRSSIEHNLAGDFNTPVGSTPVSATLDTPEMVTFSISQAVSNAMRVMGTVEWSNWSRVATVPVVGFPGGAVIDANWDDGWFVSGGAEYDYMPGLTLRGGVAYEKSPIREPGQRLSQLPDSDRVWLSVGASYRYSEATTLDFSFAHIFFEDEHLTRGALSNSPLVLDADVENSANIISVGMRTRW